MNSAVKAIAIQLIRRAFSPPAVWVGYIVTFLWIGMQFGMPILTGHLKDWGKEIPPFGLMLIGWADHFHQHFILSLVVCLFVWGIAGVFMSTKPPKA